MIMAQSVLWVGWGVSVALSHPVRPIEQHVFNTNAGKSLSSAATDV